MQVVAQRLEVVPRLQHRRELLEELLEHHVRLEEAAPPARIELAQPARELGERPGQPPGRRGQPAGA